MTVDYAEDRCELYEIWGETDSAFRCAREAIGKCVECGNLICGRHGLKCPICQRFYCESCYIEHQEVQMVN